MRGLILISMIAVVLSFQNCSDAIFSKSSGGSGDPVILSVPPGVVPGFGDILDCNSDFNLSEETLAAVSCTDGDGADGIYVCRIPLDGQGSVDTLCLSPEAALVEVSNACVCDEEEPHDGECHNRHEHVWNWFQYLKDKHKKHKYGTSTYDDDSSSSDDDSSSSDDDSSSSDDDSSSSDDDSSSSDDDSNSSDDDSHDNDEPAVCVPSETLQYRLGNCADLF